MELESTVDEFEAEGLAVAAISYDTPEILTLSPRLPGVDEPNATELTIPLTFSYQACDDMMCYIPAEIELTFKLKRT